MAVQGRLPTVDETLQIQAADIHAQLVDVLGALLLVQRVEQHAVLHRCQGVDILDVPGRDR
ncbi:hypothetical protein D3C81_843240 [compost metagenome]